MHITCTGMTREYIIDALDKAKAAGVRNVLALRGDPPFGQ
jgi:methylenetetrahydrofolate reductase (NADPH)